MAVQQQANIIGSFHALVLGPALLTFVFRLAIGAEGADITPMQTLTLSEAQRHLAELVRGLTREGELVITDAD